MKARLPWLMLVLGATGWSGEAGAQIFIGPQGSGLLAFDAAPPVQEWATQSIGEGNSAVRDAAALDTWVQQLPASTNTVALATTFSQPPTQNNYARWNSPGRYLQSRIGNNAFTVLMATLLNNSGTALGSVGVSYDLGGGAYILEDVPGFRGYFSLTGSPGSWQVIPEFCTGATGSVSAVLQSGWWAPGALLYLLWADDNGPSTDGYYTLDNVRVTLGPALSIRAAGSGAVDVSWPASWWNHELQVSTSLFEPNWQTAIGWSSLTNGEIHLRLEVPADNSFFRTRSIIIIPNGE